MNEEALFETTAIIDIDEQIRKEEELLNTIKMEPILGTTEIEEEVIAKKKKRIKFTDCFLLFLILVLSALFIVVVIKVR